MVKKSKRNEEEEEYFQREDIEKKEKIRRERQLKALRQEERENIAQKLNTSEAVAQEAMELGFDAETARVLPLVPLIQVAWADGKVTTRQFEKVKKKAKRYGVQKDTPAYEFLELLLHEEPTGLFFDRVNQVIRNIVDEDPGGKVSSNVLSWSKAVAQSSGGFFGLTNPISNNERAVLDEFAELFGIVEN